jgi:DNA-directed RNA polymerase subunit K/omega
LRPERALIHRPSTIGTFEFVILASLRAKQLLRGCVPRSEGGHKAVVIAQLEVAEGSVAREVAPSREPGPVDAD